jgi:hypothetical protein
MKRKSSEKKLLKNYAHAFNDFFIVELSPLTIYSAAAQRAPKLFM